MFLFYNVLPSVYIGWVTLNLSEWLLLYCSLHWSLSFGTKIFCIPLIICSTFCLYSISYLWPFFIAYIFYIVPYFEPFFLGFKYSAYTVITSSQSIRSSDLLNSHIQYVNMFLCYNAPPSGIYTYHSITYSEPFLISSSILFPALKPSFWYSNLLSSQSSLLYKIQVLLLFCNISTTFCPHSLYFSL